MKDNQEIQNIWENLGDLENAIVELEDLENLLVILEEGYFDKSNIDLNNPDDMFTLWRDYKYKQSLLTIIKRFLRIANSNVKDNVYEIYDSVKKLKNQSINNSQNILSINKTTA